MKKIIIILVLGFLLLLGSNAGAQFATPLDSSDVAGWNFLIQVLSDENIRAGTATDEYYLTYEATGDSFEWVSLPGGGDANKSDIHDSLFANTPGYLTGNESITLSGDATGSGATAITVTVVDDLHDHVYSNIDETTSANWIGRVSDETGTGLWVFGTSPTFTTDITSPLVIGGTATTSDLSLKTTSGVGETGADMHFLVGNNGATEAMTILNNGKVGLGTDSTSSILHVKANTPGTVGSHPAGQLIIQNPSTNTVSNAVITGYNSDGNGNPDQQLWYLGGASGSTTCLTLLNRRNSKLFLGTNSTTRMTIAGGDGNVGIGTLSPPERLSVVGNIATGDSTTGDVDVYHYFSTDNSWTTEYLKWDDGLGEFQFSDDLTVTGDAYHVTSTEPDSQFMSKQYIDDAAGGLTAQGVKGDHVDSTSEDFVFDGAYHITSAEADSEFMSKKYINDAVATLTEEEVEDFVGGMLGGTETGIAVTYEDASNDIDFVVDSEPWDSTTSWGNLINVHQDSIVSWANLVNAATDTIGDWTSLVNEAKDSLTAWANMVNAHQDTVANWTSLVNEAKDSLTAWANMVNAHQDTIVDWTALVNEAKDSLTAWANKVNSNYDHSQDNTQAHTDYLLNTGDAGTGDYDFGGASGFEIPAVADPTTNAEGEIAWDADDDAIEVYSGDESESVLIPMYQKLDAHIYGPDGIDDEISIFRVDALLYPFGIEIDQLSISLPGDAAYSMVFEEWAGDPLVAQNDIETVTTASDDGYMEVGGGDIDDAAIDADDEIFLHVPATDVDWIKIQIIFHVNDGN